MSSDMETEGQVALGGIVEIGALGVFPNFWILVQHGAGSSGMEFDAQMVLEGVRDSINLASNFKVPRN